ncbi:MAG: ATP-binding cassette domain-containing protein [Spirochaetes bacterium]|nr:ATP-binding cassette domain-containing protein [Spirochaetota bacterium]MBU0955643.1 ATP-binding cassette domain-containing protein [Spirochaetota bacterium]
MIEVKKVVKQYDSVLAVDKISFTANSGEIFGLIGPNGAGKTTTIRMIMNIIAPDSGQILIDGHPMRESDKARIGYLPEERGLYKKMKVGELLAFLSEIKGGDRKACAERADKWLTRFGIYDWKERKVDELSKGMAQKVQFIGTVAHDPQVLLFDEPFSGLDPLSQDLLLQAFLDLKRQGKTILFSTHIMDHAEKICERILLINKSREVISGSLAEVKSRHGTPAVRIEYDGNAGFVAKLPFVKSVREFPRALEVELASVDDTDSLYSALAGKLKVRRFELLEPSLHSIFIRLVGTDKEGSTNA